MTALPVYCCLVFIVSLSLRSNACWIPFSTTKLFGMLDEAESFIQFHWSVLHKDAIYLIIRIENDFDSFIFSLPTTDYATNLGSGFRLVTSNSDGIVFP